MARITLGFGTSHSTQCSIGPEWWAMQGEFDRRRTPFDHLVRNAPPSLAAELDLQVWQRKYDVTQQAISTLAETLAKAAPDVLIVIGDDQKELFLDDGMPMFTLFLGEELWDLPDKTKAMSPSHQAGRWAVHGEVPEAYPSHPVLGNWLTERLAEAGFDIAQFSRQPEGRSLGHAWTFIRRRLMTNGRFVPMVPVMVNTYFPPNQPTPARCYALGQAIRLAVEAWPSDATVAIAASGGLSHFVIDEALDRRVIDGIRTRDVASLTSLPRDQLQAGSSEILNWVAAAGALEHLDMKLINYIPGYRSPAGTGCGMTFALWQ